jgi:hypothetical protein
MNTGPGYGLIGAVGNYLSGNFSCLCKTAYSKEQRKTEQNRADFATVLVGHKQILNCNEVLTNIEE